MNTRSRILSSIGAASLIGFLCGANCFAENSEQQSGSLATDTVTVLGKYSADEAPESKSKERIVAEQIEQLPVRDSTMEVGGGVSSIVWAMSNPAEAWRILAPTPSE